MSVLPYLEECYPIMKRAVGFGRVFAHSFWNNREGQYIIFSTGIQLDLCVGAYLSSDTETNP